MIRDNYIIVKAEVSASCKYYACYYELNIWFQDDDSQRIIYNVPMDIMKEHAGVKRGDGFKKIKEYLNTDEGKIWLSEYLKEMDTEEKVRELKDSIRLSVYKMSLSQMEEFDNVGKQMVKRTD